MKLASIYKKILETDSLFRKTKQHDINVFLQSLKNISWKDIELKLSPGANITYDVHFKDRSIQKHYYNMIEKYTDVIIGSIDIRIDNHNEIHWPQGLPKIFRGINLGFKIYKAIIYQFGYITSVKRASDEIRQFVYEKLKKDPDVIVTDENGVLTASKK